MRANTPLKKVSKYLRQEHAVSVASASRGPMLADMSTDREGPQEDMTSSDAFVLENVDLQERSDIIKANRELSESETQILHAQLDTPTVTIRFPGLYRYATQQELWVLAISALCAICAGAALPLMTVCHSSASIASQAMSNLLFRSSSERLLASLRTFSCIPLVAPPFAMHLDRNLFTSSTWPLESLC